MPLPGPHNDLTDVPGLKVGSHTAPEALSGCTVVLCPPEGAVAGVDVRGAAPGTRETDLLNPVNLVERVQAVMLSGGSTYGLACADGAVRWLEEQGLGFALDDQGHVAPIVPGAVLFDLGRGAEFVPPVGADWGRAACQAAADGPVDLGCVGAGTGAVAGGVKGGLGSASEKLESGVFVAALVAVNSLGSLLDPATGRLWEERLELSGEFGPERPAKVLPPWPPQPAQNTTIAVVATDAALDKAQCTKMAQMAQDGLARAIRPAHTMFDGDTVFALSTCGQALPSAPGVFGPPAATALSEIGRSAADCLSRAIIRAVLSATSLGGWPCLTDLENRKK
ncbi:MAG: P1 family peptidase [Desulfarculaceae bacterium]|nr:P1 family peptidase [Desulfarculaceae bacterium]MCF8073478.1 P1 family peptidase [Desulfarculaceae bacterium]MCF8100375.1 P1 family peptidase [Desulfarculaceae bacterium]MCF8115889.1 P1 family peptidase [Desulfarculaceae bacterium]